MYIHKMFEGLFKSKFYNKCKSNIELTKNRIEIIKKKRNAMLRYLRSDVSELLKNGFDMDAYIRVEGVLVLLIKLECYEFVEKCCIDVENHLIMMDKERECPEDCKEAVSSLMHAAAIFGDLPELRELRTLFSRKYSNSIDCFVNNEFAEKLKSGMPSNDKKLQLLQEIAFEHGLEWNSKALENKLFNDQKELDTFEHKPPIKDVQVDNTITRTEYQDNQSLARNLHHEEEDEEEVDKPIRYRFIPPPPYTKSQADHETNHRKNKTKLTDNEKTEHVPQRILKFLDNGNNNNSEEESILDKLLRRYSWKRGTHWRAKSDPFLELPQEKKEYYPTGSDQDDSSSEESHPNESTKRHARASSLGHVHPKLPDYDGIVAKLEELKKRK